MKRLSLFLLLFVVFLLSKLYAQSQFYYVISIDEEPIYLNGKLIKAKDKIPAKAKLYFSSHEAKAVIYAPNEGKFIISAHRDRKGHQPSLMLHIEDAMMAPMDYFFHSTRGDAEKVNLEDLASVLQDNPTESDIITIYFIDNEPFVVNVPKILLEKDAYFAMQNKANLLRLPVENGKLYFKTLLEDAEGKMINIQSIPQLDLYYHASSAAHPYLLGRMKFEIF
jgi:hypothetical protein